LAGRCSFLDGKVGLDGSLYGLTYASWRTPAAFERDDRRSRWLVDKLQATWSATESLRLDFGKLRPDDGNFYLYSPASLMKNDYGGFKATRLNADGMVQVYQESFWGAALSQVMPDYTLSLTVAPRLTGAPAYYRSSGNWSALARSNATGRYLLSWTGYGIENHTLSASMMASDTASLAFSDRYIPDEAWAVNLELAWHASQQWRHLDDALVQRLQQGDYPSELYSASRTQNIELAVGTEYTASDFSQLGVEYYFQSAGYSAAEWRKQTDLIKALRSAGAGTPFGQFFDAYKYLMASEIYNVSAQGRLLGRHYLTGWSSLALPGQAKLQPYLVVNLRDGSTLSGVRFSSPLIGWSENLELYTGVFIAAGGKDSEFGLFGRTLGAWSGFKYHF
jgi:hypothetical protein